MEKITDLNGKREQNVAIKFCVRLGKSPKETVEMIRFAYKDLALSENKIFEWHKKFSGLSVVDDGRVKFEGGTHDEGTSGEGEEGAAKNTLMGFHNNNNNNNDNDPGQIACGGEEDKHEQQARIIKAMIKKDRRVSVEEVAEATHLELVRVHVIIHEILGYKKIGERWKKKKSKFRNDL